MKTFREFVVEKRKNYIDTYENLCIEILEDEIFVANILLDFNLDDDTIEDSGADYGEDDSYVWFYDWNISDKESIKIVKKYKLDKLLSELMKDAELSSGSFGKISSKVKHYEQDSGDSLGGWIDISQKDYELF